MQVAHSDPQSQQTETSSHLATTANDMATKTSETMSSAAANLSAAVSGSLSGGVNMGASKREETRTTTSN